MTAPPVYQFLHRHGEWPAFAFEGVEVNEQGAIALATLPVFGEPVTGSLPPVPGLEGPAGVSSDGCGNLWIADAAEHRILRVAACDDRVTTLGCLTGPGAGPGELHSPHGLVVGPRNALYIADTGNQRILVIDLATEQVRGVWGRPAATVEDLEDPGTLAQPWDLCADRRDRIYVADPGMQSADGVWRGGRVQRFSVDGRVDEAWGRRLADLPGTARPRAPTAATTILLDPGDPTAERLLVLDRDPSRLLVYTLEGSFDEETTARWERGIARADAPASVVEQGGAIYVADATRSRVFSFGTSGDFRGVIRTGGGGPAGLAFDCAGRLVLHSGGGGAVWRALDDAGYAECGTFLAGPFSAPSQPTRWQRIEVGADPLPAGAHLFFYTLTSNTLDGSPGNVPSHPAACAGAAPPDALAASGWNPAPLDQWRAAPGDATDFLALNDAGEYLWIAARLEGDGLATPVLRQIQIGFDQPGWLQHVPALFTRDPVARRFLERLLALYEGVLDGEDDLLDQLPALFDPWAAPDVAPSPTWLEWLAGWVDARLSEAWSDHERRDIVARAFREHATRGTVASLRRLVARYTGVVPVIDELGLPGPWALGETPLGFESALAPAVPEPAVVDRTAIVAASRLIPDDEIGAAAFEPYAHRFLVSVPTHQLRGSMVLGHVAQVIDREKPAHTTYDLCPIGPRFRVGLEGRVGIDTIVAGPREPSPLGDGSRLGLDITLGDGRAAGIAPPRRLGVNTAVD